MKPLIRRFVIGAFLVNLIAVTWPVVTFFRSPEPQILGLPLSMAWPIAWILICWLSLLILDHFANKHEGE